MRSTGFLIGFCKVLPLGEATGFHQGDFELKEWPLHNSQNCVTYFLRVRACMRACMCGLSSGVSLPDASPEPRVNPGLVPSSGVSCGNVSFRLKTRPAPPRYCTGRGRKRGAGVGGTFRNMSMDSRSTPQKEKWGSGLKGDVKV